MAAAAGWTDSGVGRQDDTAAFPESDACAAWFLGKTAENHFVAVFEEGAGFAAWQHDRIASARGKFEQAAALRDEMYELRQVLADDENLKPWERIKLLAGEE